MKIGAKKRIVRIFSAHIVRQICLMVHRGEIVERAVRESAYSLTKLAQKLGKSRRHIYNMFDNNRLDWETVKEIGKIIHHDFSKDFEELKTPEFLIASENGVTYKKHDLESCVEELNQLKDRYIELLEKYNQALALQVEKNVYKRKSSKKAE